MFAKFENGVTISFAEKKKTPNCRSATARCLLAHVALLLLPLSLFLGVRALSLSLCGFRF